MVDRESTAMTSEPESLGMAKIVRLASQEKKFIGTVLIATAVLVLVGVLLMANSYTATTTLMPPQQNRSIASALLSQLGAASGLVSGEGGLKDPNDVFIAILQSRSIADALIAQHDLRSVYHRDRPEDLRNELAERTHIRSGKGGVISVSVDDPSPARAAALANSYVVELYRLNSRIAVTEAGQRRAFFENQYKLAEQELVEAQERFKRTQQSTGIVQLDAQARGIVEGTAALESQLAAKEVEVKAMQSYATDENPSLKLAEQEVAALREQLAKADKHHRSGTMDIAISQLPSAAMEYATKLRELKYKEGVLEAVGKQLEIARIDEAKDAPLIQVIDPAVPPTKPSGPNRAAIAVTAIMSAFVVATGWLFFREHYRRKPIAWTPKPSVNSDQW